MKEFRYTNFQDQQENAYCGGYSLAAMINLFEALPPNKPYGMDIYQEVQNIQKEKLHGQRRYFIDKMSQYLHDQNVEGTYSLPSSIAIYAQRKGMHPTVYYNTAILKENLAAVVNDIKLANCDIEVFIEEEISLIKSFKIPVIGNATTFFLSHSIALVETAMHWIAIGNTEEKEEKKRYYDPMSINEPVYEYSGINITLR